MEDSQIGNSGIYSYGKQIEMTHIISIRCPSTENLQKSHETTNNLRYNEHKERHLL